MAVKLRFDADGRALPHQFIGAEELAEAAGLDVDEEAVAERRKKEGSTLVATGTT